MAIRAPGACFACVARVSEHSNNPRRNSLAHIGNSLQANLHHWMFVLDQIDDRFEKLIRRNPWVLIDSVEQPPSKEEEDFVNGSLFRLLRFSCVLVHNCCNKTTYNSLEVCLCSMLASSYIFVQCLSVHSI